MEKNDHYRNGSTTETVVRGKNTTTETVVSGKIEGEMELSAEQVVEISTKILGDRQLSQKAKVIITYFLNKQRSIRLNLSYSVINKELGYYPSGISRALRSMEKSENVFVMKVWEGKKAGIMIDLSAYLKCEETTETVVHNNSSSSNNIYKLLRLHNNRGTTTETVVSGNPKIGRRKKRSVDVEDPEFKRNLRIFCDVITRFEFEKGDLNKKLITMLRDLLVDETGLKMALYNFAYVADTARSSKKTGYLVSALKNDYSPLTR